MKGLVIKNRLKKTRPSKKSFFILGVYLDDKFTFGTLFFYQ